MTTISVIVPAFNAAHTLAETLASARAKTQQPIEIIVVNDGSTDSTESTAIEAATVVPHAWAPVRLINQPNQGVAAAMNQGISAARGDWIAVLDADDLWSRDCLSDHLAYLAEHTHLAACLGWVDEFTCPFQPQSGTTGLAGGRNLGEARDLRSHRSIRYCSEIGHMDRLGRPCAPGRSFVWRT